MSDTEIYQQIVANANAVLEGMKGIVEASREMRPMLLSLGEDVLGLDCVQTILLIESETDDEPSGVQRELWAPEVLEERDRKLKEYLGRVQRDVETACRQLVLWFGQGEIK